MSALTSLQVCVAGTSHGSADYTPNSPTFPAGGTTPRLKQLRKKSLHCQVFPGSVEVSFVDKTLSITRWQESRSPGQKTAATGQAQGTVCTVLERSKLAVSSVQLYVAVRLQSRAEQRPTQHCRPSLENSLGKKKQRSAWAPAA